jgi:hypothetical protein
MTSREYTNATAEPEPENHPPPTSECDPSVLDDVRCEARGIAAQAEYLGSKQAALEAARTQYEGARKAYGEAQEAAEPLVKAGGKQLDKLIDQLVCLINDASVTRKLDRAYETVAQRLKQCGDQSGCYCRLDCDFDEMRRCPPADVPARIADIEQRTKAAEECFNDLVREPTKLAERVAAVQAEIKDIETKIGGTPDPSTFRRLYAAALVARRHLKAVRRGFADINAYIDCLCQALICILRGHTAIADLKRRLAKQQCHKDAEDKACTRLRENTVDEVLAAYLKPPSEGYDQPPKRPPGYEQPPEQYDQPPQGYDQPPKRPPEGYGQPPKGRDDRDERQPYSDRGTDRGTYRRDDVREG